MFNGRLRPSRWIALDKRGGDVEIQRVAKFVELRCAAGFDAGGHVAGVMAAETGFPQRAQKIPQGFVTEEVETLVGDLELRLLAVAGLASGGGRFRGVGRIVDRDVVFLLHAFDEFLDQLLELAFHLHLLQPLAHLFVEQIAVEKGLLDRPPEGIEILVTLGHVVKHVILEAALQQIVRQRAEQVLHAHFACGIGDVFGITDATHKSSSQFAVLGSQKKSEMFNGPSSKSTN